MSVFLRTGLIHTTSSPTFVRSSNSLRAQFSSRYSPANIYSLKKDYSVKSADSKITCTCQKIEDSKIAKMIKDGDTQELKKCVINDCQWAQTLQRNWKAYAPENLNFANNCKLRGILEYRLSAKIREQSNIQGMGIPMLDLSALIMQEGKVTLAAESGALVGKKEYWEPVLHILETDTKPVRVVSLGGGTGEDGKAIASVISNKGLLVKGCEIIDPNPLAAWLCSKNDVMFYMSTAQEYFSSFFTREAGSRYVFHLGTLLNIVSEVAAIQILQDLAKNMAADDVFSILMIDQKQFTLPLNKKQIVCIPGERPVGLAKLVYAETHVFYKTVIVDQKKFIAFCGTQGLQAIDVSEIKAESGAVTQVTFITTKGVKAQTS